MFTEQEIEWQTELEKQKLAPILELLKGTSFEDARKILLKAEEKLAKVKEGLIF